MPPKNSLKTYVDDSFYHIYNRGVATLPIFEDRDDYVSFLADLKFYLTPVRENFKGVSLKVTQEDKTYTYFPSQQPKNHTGKIELIAYCLIPNHFHRFIKQTDKMTMSNFMRSLATKYSMYFNKKYNRVGPVFQGTYKAVPINNELQFLYLTKYIHRNPLALVHNNPSNLYTYPYSSYPNYLKLIHQSWVHCDDVLYYFSKFDPKNSYQRFVEESESEIDGTTILTLE